MGGRECCVKNCTSSSHDHQGRMLLNGLSFHCFPAWRTKEGDLISDLTRRRRAAWVAAVGRIDITFDRIPSSMRVCSRHFVSGKPAYEMLDSDPDWVPSLHLGQDADIDGGEGPSRKRRRRPSLDGKQVEGPEGAADVRKPPWKDVKSGLQSLLESKTGVTPQNRVAGRRTDTSFRDHFRNALESSLEASIQARARSKRRSSSTEYELKLNFKLPSLEGGQTSRRGASSSSCLNCSWMLRRIKELEQKLFELTSKQQLTDNNGDSAAGTQMDQDQHRSEEDRDEMTGHVKVAEVLDFGSNSEPDSDSTPFNHASLSAYSASSTSCSPPPAAPAPPGRPRFRKEWLQLFPFLRYSPTLDIMWCHVCRVHSDPVRRRRGLIRGSSRFTKTNIMKHGSASYHQQNVQRFLWSSRERPDQQSGQGSTS